jgi:hypothetical protein
MSTTIIDPGVSVPLGEARPGISWSAIFAGAVLFVAIQLLLSILGAGIGLGFVNPGHADGASATTLGTGAGLWWVGSTVLALIAGGYVAARLAGVSSRFDGTLHGLVVWGMSLLLTVYLLAGAVGGIAGGAFSAISATVSAAGSTIGGAANAVGAGAKSLAPATPLSADALRQQAQQLLQSPAAQDPAAMNTADATKAVAQAMPALLAGGPKADAARQRITQIVAAQAHISQQDAQQRVDSAVTTFNQDKLQAEESARNAANASAEVASQAAFLAFVALLVGAVAGALGGAIASPRRLVPARRADRDRFASVR